MPAAVAWLSVQIPDSLFLIPSTFKHLRAQLHIPLASMSLRKILKVSLDLRTVGEEVGPIWLGIPGECVVVGLSKSQQ